MKVLQYLKLLISGSILLLAKDVKSQDFYGKATFKYIYNFPTSTKDTLIGELYFNDIGESYFKGESINTIRKTSSSYESKTPVFVAKRDSDIVYRNIISKEYFYHKWVFMSVRIVSDTLKDLDWVLNKQQKKIGNFNCSYATTNFSGRNYQVWYTPEIPVNSGPWKLYGLPGLIVEAQDEEGVVHFFLDKIEISPAHKKDFGLENLRKKAISKQALKKEKEKNIEKFKSYGKSMGVSIKVGSTTKGLELEDN